MPFDIADLFDMAVGNLLATQALSKTFDYGLHPGTTEALIVVQKIGISERWTARSAN